MNTLHNKHKKKNLTQNELEIFVSTLALFHLEQKYQFLGDFVPSGPSG